MSFYSKQSAVVSRLSILNFTFGNSLCSPCCWNVSIVLPKDCPSRVETCWSDI